MNIKYAIGAISALPFLPLMYIQGKQVKAKVPDLPEATGTAGFAAGGSRTTLNLVILGESTMAGVGVRTHEEGFAGTIAKQLAKRLKTNIQWKVYAKSGYSVKKVHTELVPNIAEKTVDLIVVGIGANDCFELNSPTKWRKDLQTLIEQLQLSYPNAAIFFTTMPPIKSFPALGPLLQFYIGNLSELLEYELIDLLLHYPTVHYDARKFTASDWNDRHQLNQPLTAFFSDGVHPSKIAYQVWAKEFATFMVEEYDR